MTSSLGRYEWKPVWLGSARRTLVAVLEPINRCEYRAADLVFSPQQPGFVAADGESFGRRSSWPWFTKATSTRSTSVPRWTSSWSPASPRIDGPQAGRDGYMSDRTGQAQARPPACATLRRSMVLCAMKRSMWTGTRLQTAFAKHGGPELRPAEALTAPVRQARPVRRVTGWMRKLTTI